MSAPGTARSRRAGAAGRVREDRGAAARGFRRTAPGRRAGSPDPCRSSGPRAAPAPLPRPLCVLLLDLLARRWAPPVQDHDAVAEGGGLPRREREIVDLLPFREILRAERVRGVQAIPAGVPVCWEVVIRRVVEDRDRDRLALHDAAERGPARARAPQRIAVQRFGAPVAP